MSQPPRTVSEAIPARLDVESRVSQAVGSWLLTLGAAKPSPATLSAYRRDIEGVGGRLAGPDGTGGYAELRIADLGRRALLLAFSSWAGDHAASSVRRAHSAWSSFFDFLVSEEVVSGSPMAAIPKPKNPSAMPRSIRASDIEGRLLRTASQVDPTGRDPWPSRDLALIATFCVTGVREAEASGLNLGSLSGDRGARRMEVTGKGGKVRPIPIDASLEAVIDAYMRSRVERFPREDLDHPTVPVFVDGRGRRLSVDQIRYIVEKLYVRAGVRSQVPAGALVHALRHTFATNALEAGADVVELQELLGHASLETTRRYLSATAQGLRHVIQAHPAQAALRGVVEDTDALR